MRSPDNLGQIDHARSAAALRVGKKTNHSDLKRSFVFRTTGRVVLSRKVGDTLFQTGSKIQPFLGGERARTSRCYLTAPTVKPSMKRSRKMLYRIPIGTAAIRQPAISDCQ